MSNSNNLSLANIDAHLVTNFKGARFSPNVCQRPFKLMLHLVFLSDTDPGKGMLW